MAGFKSSNRNSKSGNQRTLVNRVLKEGISTIPSYLKEEDGITELRMIPYIDPETNEVAVLLNPDGHISDIYADDLGLPFCWVEIAKIYMNGVVHSFISRCLKDDAGNTMEYHHMYIKSPFNVIMNRIGYKVYEQTEKMKKGHPTDVPKTWIKWRSEGALKEAPLLCHIQCMGLTIAGEERTDMDGNIDPITPAVFSIPGSAKAAFFKKLFKKKKKDEDLSESNNRFGDIYSAEHGKILELSKVVAEQTSYLLDAVDELPLEEPPESIPWEDVFEEITVEESIQIILSIFKDPALIDYGLRTSEAYRGYIPENCQGASEDIEEAIGIKELRALKQIDSVTRTFKSSKGASQASNETEEDTPKKTRQFKSSQRASSESKQSETAIPKQLDKEEQSAAERKLKERLATLKFNKKASKENVSENDEEEVPF